VTLDHQLPAQVRLLIAATAPTLLANLSASGPDAPAWLYAAVGAVVGSTLGAVLTTWIPRSLGTDRSSLLARSHCPHCRRRLRLVEATPVLSWMVLGGRCRSCKTPIPGWYPLAEGGGAAAGAASLGTLGAIGAAPLLLAFVAALAGVQAVRARRRPDETKSRPAPVPAAPEEAPATLTRERRGSRRRHSQENDKDRPRRARLKEEER
jgi:hypothetical protein